MTTLRTHPVRELGVFPADGDAPGRLVRFLPGEARRLDLAPLYERLEREIADLGVRLCFSDATGLPDGRVLFTAVAEAGEDTYLDGALMGAGVGLLDSRGERAGWHPLDPPAKVEGVEAELDGQQASLLLVADADDPRKPSPLLAARLDVRAAGLGV